MNDINFVSFCSYDNQLLAEYKVQCSPGELAFINITDMDIEEGNCIDDQGISRQVYFLCFVSSLNKMTDTKVQNPRRNKCSAVYSRKNCLVAEYRVPYPIWATYHNYYCC